MDSTVCSTSNCDSLGTTETGECDPCRQWSRRNQGKDPATRRRRKFNPYPKSGLCRADGCEKEGPMRHGWCIACFKWSKTHGDADPSDRERPGKAPLDGLCSVVDGDLKCSRKHYGNGMCSLHWQRHDKYGDPLELRKRSDGALLSLVQGGARETAFTCLVEPGLEYHWSLRFNGVQTLATRAVWTIAHGGPGASFVLHKCNGGSGDHGCININHLYLGDNRQNMIDRSDDLVMTLERHPNAKLTNGQAEEILERARSGDRVGRLAAEFGVSHATISNLIRGVYWRRLPGRGQL